jgi:hypothetical protein
VKIPVDERTRRCVLSTPTLPDERALRSVMMTRPPASPASRFWVLDWRKSNDTLTCLPLWATASAGSPAASMTMSTRALAVAMKTD